MIENRDEPAFPVEVQYSGDVIRGQQTSCYGGWATGLTKREYLAALAMQGMLANSTYNGSHPDGIAILAKRHADALLETLKPKEMSPPESS